jgi:hypothetical protein
MQAHSFFRKSLFLMLLTFSVATTQSFAAMSIGRNGSPYVENGISWQPVQFTENNQGFTAAVPGQPKSGITTPWYFVYSNYEKTDYEIHTSANERFLPPSSDADFLTTMEKLIDANEYFIPVEAAFPEVLYAAEVSTNDQETGDLVKIWRLYWTADNRMYYAVVDGPDLSLAPEFFNKITFKTH